jgi:hypothetical protein
MSFERPLLYYSGQLYENHSGGVGKCSAKPFNRLESPVGSTMIAGQFSSGCCTGSNAVKPRFVRSC